MTPQPLSASVSLCQPLSASRGREGGGGGGSAVVWSGSGEHKTSDGREVSQHAGS